MSGKTGMRPNAWAGPIFLEIFWRAKKTHGTMEWLRYTATPDDIWEERDKYQDAMNAERAESRGTRSYVLRDKIGQ